MSKDKLVRVSEGTHCHLTELGKKGETYDQIICKLLKETLDSKSKEKILTSCRKIKTILESIHHQPMKSPLRTPVVQKFARDIKKSIDEIESIADL